MSWRRVISSLSRVTCVRRRATRFWCAKEAVAKALGRGLSDGPRSVVVRGWLAGGETTAQLEAELGPGLAAEFPQFADKRLRVFTEKYKKYIVATTFCDEG